MTRPPQPDFAQDPEERFDVITADGRPAGITKARKDVHRDGDWHRSIHVWVFGVDHGTPFILMNRRGQDKDTWPGYLDVTVGGHLAAGETVAEAYREIDEEIGIVADPAHLTLVGTRLGVSEAQPGALDREIQEVFILRDDRPLSGYHPNPAELEALVRFDLEDAIALFAMERNTITATSLSAMNASITQVGITDADLLPVGVDQYFLRVAVAIERSLRGDRYVLI